MVSIVMLSSTEIRRQFLEFFEKKHGHTLVDSAPVIPHGDDTLLFTNAGMNQFKEVFLGLETRAYTRAVDTQKCIRAGGKHNDLDAVGKDTYHHTFFEMLGNWSFGDYFKKEAITWAWELLTDVWGLEKDRLHATVFEGDQADGLEADSEAAEIWRTETDIDHNNIHFCSKKDNFWEMGDTGPCGPCSEIHIDLTPDKSGRDLVNMDDPRVIEIWNLVFIQFNRDVSGELKTLPAKHVDTGMGFERICAALQGKISTYDSDLFAPFFQKIQALSGAEPYGGDLEKVEDIAYRVIADHIRTLTFAIADGAVPDKDGRGYVLRRILRRAVRYGRQILGMEDPFFYQIVPVVVEQMGDVFPELKKDPQKIADIIKEEEIQFGHTWERGIKLFLEEAEKGGKEIEGEVVFRLESTYGFPYDLTELMAEEKGMGIDKDGYLEHRKQHQLVSKGSTGQLDVAKQTLVEIVQQGQFEETIFTGYTETAREGATLSHVYALEDGQFHAAETLQAGQLGAVVLDQTPFYAESGGQVGDRGTLTTDSGAQFDVEDTLKVGGVFFHIGELSKGSLQEKQTSTLKVDAARRQKIMAHHTTTHILNHKLRAVLGDDVDQKGSLVDDMRTRFDFSHSKSLSRDEIAQIETLVQSDIAQKLPVYDMEVPQEKAFEIHGLRAVFGEKYPPMVRVVSIGVPIEDLLATPEKKDWYAFSAELCGGIHLPDTSEAGAFVITAEEGVGKGVRRLIGITGDKAREAITNGEALLKDVEQLASAAPEEVAGGLSRLREQLHQVSLPLLVKDDIQSKLGELQKIVKQQQKQHTKAVTEVAKEIAEAHTGALIVAALEDADQAALRAATDIIHQMHPESAMLLGSVVGDKVAFVARVPDALIKKGLKAGDWVKTAAKVAGGGGGGRPNMAQAGGKDPSKLQDALDAGKAFAEGLL